MATVLVVDDREVNRSLMATQLGYAGHVVVEAGDGIEALRVARARRPDVVVTDMLMPGMDGYEFVRRLRADASLSATPVVFCTANFLEEEVWPIAAACGVSQVLFRSGDPGRLVAMVEAALAQPAVVPGAGSRELVWRHVQVLNAKLLQKVEELAAREEELSARAEQLAQANAQLARINESLRVADGVRDEFVRCVSHELREPLTSMLGHAELVGDLAQGRLDGDELAMVERIGRGASRLLVMVNDLLTLAGADADGSGMRVGPVDLSTVVGRACAPVAPMAAGMGVRLVVDVVPALVCGDDQLLERALGHLLVNAVKFSPDGGTVTIRMTPSGHQCEVAVCDTGLGMDATDRQKAFDRFFRGSAALAREIPGPGLGLAVVAAIVARHDGAVRLDSTVGAGTTVRVYLPRWAV